MPLRVGLVVAMVTLAAVVLAASGAAVTSALSRSLLDRTDEQLQDSVGGWAKPRPMHQIETVNGPLWVPADMPGAGRPPSDADQPHRFYELRRAPDGKVLVQPPVSGGYDAPDPATLPSGGPATVRAPGPTQTDWRVLTISNENGSTTIGLPLTDNQQTVSRLVAFQLIIGATALLLLAVAGYFVVQRSLRPLRQVEETAMAIAGGDMNRRVPVRDNDTEVDHLAQSLNVMLARLQQGMAATAASEESARRSEQKMRQFVADASHELRTPLTSIRGFAELYRMGASQDPAVVLQRIEGEADRMGLLVEDLLMLARLDAQRPMAREPVDLLALAGDAVHSARALSAREGKDLHPVALEIGSGTGTFEVPGDAGRLRQVLGNLLGNAIAHTPPGTPVTVRLTPDRDEVRIEVIDRGPGLPPEAAARVFERFFRTDTSRARSSGGSGLGLSIVQAMVTAHGGQVTVDSVEGEGATFTVRLPRAH
ncbi:HAMP domain-containing protein [Nocardia stercoris]|uniref:histidine kinase n=1 Tax=Nocardia stercoris TaxID=2483361 RepID=A0A3M2LAQ0_9NOCA|nr:HAMP domain-containing protein [Nocardia stercoris]